MFVFLRTLTLLNSVKPFSPNFPLTSDSSFPLLPFKYYCHSEICFHPCSNLYSVWYQGCNCDLNVIYLSPGLSLESWRRVPGSSRSELHHSPTTNLSLSVFDEPLDPPSGTHLIQTLCPLPPTFSSSLNPEILTWKRP